MSTVRYEILTWLESNPGVSAAELAAGLDYPVKRVSKHINKARLQGLVWRRAGRYWLTENGMQRLTHVIEHNLIEDYS